MRGVPLQLVYWLLAAIYLFAALGSAVASGEISTAVSLQLAASAPAVLQNAAFRPAAENHRRLGLAPLCQKKQCTARSPGARILQYLALITRIDCAEVVATGDDASASGCDTTELDYVRHNDPQLLTALQARQTKYHST